MFRFTVNSRTGWQKVVLAKNTVEAAQMGWPDRITTVVGNKADGWVIKDYATGRKLGTMKTEL